MNFRDKYGYTEAVSLKNITHAVPHTPNVINSLCGRVLQVLASQFPRDVLAQTHHDHYDVLAVFNSNQDFLGLVPSREAELFPERSFAELLPKNPPLAITGKASLHEALKRFSTSRQEFLPVVDDQDKHIGVISRYSLFNKLLEQQNRLLHRRESLIKHLKTELGQHQIAQAVFDNTSEGVIVADADKIIQWVNPAFCRTTGYSIEEVVGQKPQLLKSGRQDLAFYQAMWHAILTQGVWQGEIWNRRKNGEIYPEWLTINCLRGDNGEILRYVAVFSDISARHQLQESLHRLAYFDALTTLPNRTLFQDRLQQAIAHSERSGQAFALLFIDLDNFKHINDTLGHSYGDAVLTEIGTRLQSVCRKSDTAARLGGDEFAMLLLDQNNEVALAKVVDNIFSSLHGNLTIKGHEVFVTASIGVALYPQDAHNAEMLLSNADIAMYRAKSEGRERICYYKPALSARINEHLNIENSLRHAFENEHFYLTWQPQIDLVSRQIVGAEVLLRYHSETAVPMMPGVFIPVAEKSGLITLLGDWVLDNIMHHIGLLFAGNTHPMRIAINLSMMQLNETALKHIIELADSLQPYALSLEVEFTETALMKQPLAAEFEFQRLRQHGIDIAVDDFGTAYSNLARLKALPVSRLKIDQSFMQDIDKSHEIIGAIIAIGHALHLKVLAEGVETAEQERILNGMACDEAQGYLYHHPLTSEAFHRLLVQRGFIS